MNACSGQARVSLAVVGDVLVHRPLAVRGYARGFSSLWAEAEPWLRTADLAIANLEGPVAPGITATGARIADPGPRYDGDVYTGYPRFNYHPRLLADLRHAGVDIVTVANNHSLDRGPHGMDATLHHVAAAGLRAVGAVAQGGDRWQPVTLSTRIGRITLLACSFSTNGLPDPARQVPMCADQTLPVRIAQETARGQAVIVLPHWGREYQTRPSARQRRQAHGWVQAGAIAVIGTHPHVPQPWEWRALPSGRRALVLYSTGNFVAAQTALSRATGVMAWLTLCRAPTGRATVEQAGYIPVQMDFRGADPVLRVPTLGRDSWGDGGLALLARVTNAPNILPQSCGSRRPSGRAPARAPLITDR